MNWHTSILRTHNSFISPSAEQPSHPAPASRPSWQKKVYEFIVSYNRLITPLSGGFPWPAAPKRTQDGVYHVIGAVNLNITGSQMSVFWWHRKENNALRHLGRSAQACTCQVAGCQSLLFLCSCFQKGIKLDCWCIEALQFTNTSREEKETTTSGSHDNKSNSISFSHVYHTHLATTKTYTCKPNAIVIVSLQVTCIY